MEIDKIAPSDGLLGGVRLAEAYRLLEEQRIEIDHRLAKMAPDDPARPDMWQELEDVLVGLRRVLIKLAKAPAADLADFRSKAAVLASLLRSEINGQGQLIPEVEKAALALSITDDIARLPNG